MSVRRSRWMNQDETNTFWNETELNVLRTLRIRFVCVSFRFSFISFFVLPLPTCNWYSRYRWVGEWWAILEFPTFVGVY